MNLRVSGVASCAVFMSAALVFLVEPMMGKLILPLLGGSPAVWNTSLAFFQAALLVGRDEEPDPGGARRRHLGAHGPGDPRRGADAAVRSGLVSADGRIAVIRSDADITIWDPTAKTTVDGSAMETNADYSPYDGWEITGLPVTTISRGDIIYDNGTVTAEPGRGKVVKRGPSQML